MSKTKSNAFTDTDIVIRAVEPIALNDDQELSEPVTAFVIQNVEIPRRATSRASLQYPIGTLEAGSTQSFFVPAALGKMKNVASSIRTFAYRNEFKVILRQEFMDMEPAYAIGIRVWRKK